MGRTRKLDAQLIRKEYLAGGSTYYLSKKHSAPDMTIRRTLKTTGTARRSSAIPRRHHFDKHVFHDIDTPDKAYWLGFPYADGSVSWVNRSVQIALIDRDHLHKLQQFLGSDYEKIYNRWQSYHLRYGVPLIIRIGRYLYDTQGVRLERKYQVFSRFDEWHTRRYPAYDPEYNYI
jgi:hypothetical protein